MSSGKGFRERTVWLWGMAGMLRGKAGMFRDLQQVVLRDRYVTQGEYPERLRCIEQVLPHEPSL
jgi:hypothetical protein